MGVRGGKHLRYRILKCIRDRERTSSTALKLEDIATAVGASIQDVDDQIDILDDLGAVKATRTIDGDAKPKITGTGKLMLEDLTNDVADDPTRGSAPISRRNEPEWDIFICHASEDKKTFVDELALALRRHYRVWYDKFALRVGDRLRRKIEQGLSRSRYGIVVLSPNFFAKQWPQDELDGLAARESDGHKVILPVWLNIDQAGVTSYSPMLAGRMAAKASDGMNRVVEQITEAIEERASELLPPLRDGAELETVSGKPRLAEDSEPTRPRFDVQGGGGDSGETDFSPDFKLQQFSGDPIADIQWRIHGPRLHGMEWRHSSGAQLKQTHFTHKFDLSEGLIEDDWIEENQMGFEVRFRWQGKWRSEIHRWPISRRDLGHKVLWDIGTKILPPLLIDDSLG